MKTYRAQRISHLHSLRERGWILDIEVKPIKKHKHGNIKRINLVHVYHLKYTLDFFDLEEPITYSYQIRTE